VSQSLLVRQFRVGDVLKMCGHLRRRSLSLLEQARQAFSLSTGKDRLGQSARQECTPPRRSSPLVASARPVMARRGPMVKRQHARVATLFLEERGGGRYRRAARPLPRGLSCHEFRRRTSWSVASVLDLSAE
jgi:hypothetical protein